MAVYSNSINIGLHMPGSLKIGLYMETGSLKVGLYVELGSFKNSETLSKSNLAEI